MITQQNVQRQQLHILPQQIQILNFFALNTIEIEQLIKKELDENPVLELSEEAETIDNTTEQEIIPDYQEWDAYTNDDSTDNSYEYQNYINKEQLPPKPLTYKVDFKEDAKQQLHMLAEENPLHNLAEYLIDSLNDHGILDRSIEELAEEYSFHAQKVVENEEIEAALKIIQLLEPIGIGARSIQECLLIQLKHTSSEDRLINTTIRLIEHHYDELIHCRFEKLYNSLHINNETLKRVLCLLAKLKLYPVSDSTSSIENKQTIIPDFLIDNVEGTIEINLYSTKADTLFINHKLYEKINHGVKTNDKATNKYIENKISSAKWFIDVIKQRETTMLSIMKCIVDIQRDYFQEGDISLLKPMVLRHIGDKTGYDLSTISRITTNKYADTHFGMISLKELFSEGIADKHGNIISSKVIQHLLRDKIENEDKNNPYTDQQLVAFFSNEGYNIARRTVAKYRELLNIPATQIRRILV